jgi:hypothetical protein
MKIIMSMNNHLARILLLVPVFFLSCNQISNEELLIGKWQFVKFEWPDSVNPDEKIVIESNKKFKNLIYEFTKDKKFIMFSDTQEEFNKQTTYTLKDDKRIQLETGQQVLLIDHLDRNSFKFYVEGMVPKGIFKRIN